MESNLSVSEGSRLSTNFLLRVKNLQEAFPLIGSKISTYLRKYEDIEGQQEFSFGTDSYILDEDCFLIPDHNLISPYYGQAVISVFNTISKQNKRKSRFYSNHELVLSGTDYGGLASMSVKSGLSFSNPSNFVVMRTDGVIRVNQESLTKINLYTALILYLQDPEILRNRLNLIDSSRSRGIVCDEDTVGEKTPVVFIDCGGDFCVSVMNTKKINKKYHGFINQEIFV